MPVEKATTEKHNFFFLPSVITDWTKNFETQICNQSNITAVPQSVN